MQITIIGAGPGISQAVARLFGQKGYSVALVARNEDKLKEQVQELEEFGIKGVYAVADVADEPSLTTALGQIQEQLGPADLVLYNAVAAGRRDILDEDWESFRAALDVNVGGAFTLVKQILPTYLKENKGKLFFTGGGLALYPSPMFTALSVGKAGLRAFVQALAQRVKGTNVHIATVTVCGMVNPHDPKYNPDAIANQFWQLFQQSPGEYQTEIVY
ncbi:SDR family oxidoreductase [Nibrella viscosa]|uniref:SDR family oxidoreductase n=1 Tax=Nibrella viscosa TaxID=1084524 RepID=A0ABP8JUC8_9BACT